MTCGAIPEEHPDFEAWRAANMDKPSIMFIYRNRPRSDFDFEERMAARGISRDNFRSKLVPLTIKQGRVFNEQFGLFPQEAILWFAQITGDL